MKRMFGPASVSEPVPVSISDALIASVPAITGVMTTATVVPVVPAVPVVPVVPIVSAVISVAVIVPVVADFMADEATDRSPADCSNRAAIGQ